jgi:RNA polymerase sigma factor (sigma-70 family)
LFECTRFAILDRQRKYARTERMDEHASPPDTDDDALALLIERERTTRLAQALHENCSPIEQEVILFITEGQTPDQIASALEFTAGNVRVIKHRALAKLRLALAQETTS